MYQRAHQHKELNRLVSAMAISKPFLQALMQDPQRTLEKGYLGYHFDLTPEETEAVISLAWVKNARQFSLRLWDWIDRVPDQVLATTTGTLPKEKDETIPTVASLSASVSPERKSTLKAAAD